MWSNFSFVSVDGNRICFQVFPVNFAENQTGAQQNSEGGNRFQSPSDNGLIKSCPTTITEQNHFTHHQLSMFMLDFRNTDRNISRGCWKSYMPC